MRHCSISGFSWMLLFPFDPSLKCQSLFAEFSPTLFDSMEPARQEYWSGLLFLTPGDLLDPGTEPKSPALQADSLPSEPPGGKVRQTCFFFSNEKTNSLVIYCSVTNCPQTLQLKEALLLHWQILGSERKKMVKKLSCGRDEGMMHQNVWVSALELRDQM